MSRLKRSSELSHIIAASGDNRGPFVVSICGPAGAGKSQVAKRTAEVLGHDLATRVPADYFFFPRPADMSLNDFLQLPLRWDWNLISERLTSPVGTISSTPDVDFSQFRRQRQCSGLPLIIRPIMIVDSMAPFPASDLVILLDVNEEERRRRIVERDSRWNTTVIDRWQHLETTWSEQVPFHTDVVIDGMRAIEVIASEIACAVWKCSEEERAGRRYQ